MTQTPQKQKIDVLIIIAIIGVIGATIPAVITVIGNYNVAQMNREIELTRIALAPATTQREATPTVLHSTINAPAELPAPTTATTILSTPAGEILFSDDFEDGFSHGFSFYSGNWSVVDDGTGNKALELKSGSSISNASFGTSTFSDGIIEFRFKVVSGSNPIVELNFRLNKISNWIDYIVVYNTGSLSLVYQDKKGWQPMEATNGSGSIQPITGSWITIRMEAQGENIKLFANGNLVSTALDSRLKTGELWITTFPNMVTQFDDFKV